MVADVDVGGGVVFVAEFAAEAAAPELRRRSFLGGVAATSAVDDDAPSTLFLLFDEFLRVTAVRVLVFKSLFTTAMLLSVVLNAPSVVSDASSLDLFCGNTFARGDTLVVLVSSGRLLSLLCVDVGVVVVLLSVVWVLRTVLEHATAEAVLSLVEESIVAAEEVGG